MLIRKISWRNIKGNSLLQHYKSKKNRNREIVILIIRDNITWEVLNAYIFYFNFLF